MRRRLRNPQSDIGPNGDFPIDAVFAAVKKEAGSEARHLRDEVDSRVEVELEDWISELARGRTRTRLSDVRQAARGELRNEIEALEKSAADAGIDEEILEDAFDGALDDVLQDVNIWQPFDSGSDCLSFDVRWEVDQNTSRSANLPAELVEWLEDEENYEWLQENEDVVAMHGDPIVELDDVGTAHISGVDTASISFTVSYFTDVEPSIYIPKLKELFVERVEEAVPALGESPQERDARLEREAAVLEVVADFSNAPDKRIRPYRVLNLKSRSQLALESRDMRHCVGKPGMRYADAVERGETAIWSIRTHSGKRKFTLEVELYQGRPVAIHQFKGKPNNRLPGFGVNDSKLSNMDEVLACVAMVDQLIADGILPEDAGPETIRDLLAGMEAAGLVDIERKTRKNPTVETWTFDDPYIPPHRRPL